jgi:hypothetical protein
MSPPQGPPRTLAELAGEYRHFALIEAPAHGSPLYAAICLRLADDPANGGLLLRAPLRFRAPTLLLAAVHQLLLRGASPRLGAYYPTVTGESARLIDDSLYPAFVEAVRSHRGEIERLLTTRTTQTNEARRAAVLLPALNVVAGEAVQPLALLEVGTSAGLLLRVERYGYRIGDVSAGDRASPVQIECEVHGDLRPPVGAAVPGIGWRAGMDRNPLDVGEAETADWLRALVWPEHRDRLAVLDAAISVALHDPLDLRRGDLLAGLPALAADAPRDMALVMVHAWVLAYLSPNRRRSFVREVRQLARQLHRPIWLVGMEAPDVLASLGVGLLEAGPGGFSALALSRFDADGTSSRRLMAHSHAHARWLRWLDPATAAPA